ncbi:MULTISPECIES: NAD(+) diphosphatase [Sphingobium]|uniref:NAD(+) diphosphatase n=1 Tax=Sphingobium chungbukense TaxID=56193 RepID=A0A0M3AYB6_9SPHN|nr:MULTISPECIES: NAD(+) diphosphatase [Sphingobium]KKW93569.1 NUDIX hydrolase [Sphingobium chungbukense]PJG48047.1 NADH pyrophosphatase [Sphingobium sp. LB126]
MHGSNAPETQLLGYAGGRLDRVDHIRTNSDLLAQAFASPLARRVVLEGLEPVVEGGHLAMEPLPADAWIEHHVLLGVDEGQRPIFAELLADTPDNVMPSARSRSLVSEVPGHEAALYGTARSLLSWHARHRFCSVCGQRSAPAKAGWSRRCGSCEAEHFPRVDPVVIMLAEHRGRVLLGRQHGWPQGRYSALAGFVEPGETLEEAVAREIKEEAGVAVHSVRYVMSQPWPFPSSLMIACTALADDDALKIDETEIEHAFWCDAEGVRAAMDEEEGAPFLAPPPLAVAWHLLRHWLDGQVAGRTPSA